MIRTRDLVLFLLCFGFLAVAITLTVQRGSGGESTITLGDIAPEASTTALAPEERAVDRRATIERLRGLLASDTSTITPEPDRFLDDLPPEATDEPLPTDVAPAARRCLFPDDVLPKVASWPVGKVRVGTDGGFREAALIETVAVPAVDDETGATTTATETIKTVLLRLPLVPSQVPVPSCLPSEVVGITTSGTLLFNSDARIWQNVTESTLIGYARDGYPIYGQTTAPLDECGGYNPGSGYRYALSSDRPYLIGCYRATPQSFMLP